jgi:hypothetical protein
MLVRIIANCRAEGAGHKIGDIVDFPDKVAKELCLMQRAVPVGEVTPVIESAALESLVETTSVSKPRKRRKA